MSHEDFEEIRKTKDDLKKLHQKMRLLDSRDEILMGKAYENPKDAEDRMVDFVRKYGEQALYSALLNNPERFGDYPKDKARFDEAYDARKKLPEVYADYWKCRDEADVLQHHLNKLERERGSPSPDDDLTPKR